MVVERVEVVPVGYHLLAEPGVEDLEVAEGQLLVHYSNLLRA